MKIYTRRGDQGETSLSGGQRVAKNEARVEAYGTVDELNGYLGLAAALTTDEELCKRLEALQKNNLRLGADLATPEESEAAGARLRRISASDVEELEALIDQYQEQLPPLTRFILPGGGQAGAVLHIARTVCRRAERRTVDLTRRGDINTEIGRYLNRLSDLLFVLARVANQLEGAEETQWLNE